MLVGTEFEFNYCRFYNNASDGNNPPPNLALGYVGIIQAGDCEINHCIFYNNTVLYHSNPEQKGVIRQSGGTTDINDSIFYDNTANDLQIMGGTVNLNYSAYENIFQSGGSFNEDANVILAADPFVNSAAGNFNLIPMTAPVDIRPADAWDGIPANYHLCPTPPCDFYDDPWDPVGHSFTCPGCSSVPSTNCPQGDPADPDWEDPLNPGTFLYNKTGRLGDAGIFGGPGACDW